MEKVQISPLDDTQIKAFMQAIHGHRFEDLFITVLFTGMREGEVLGLQRDCINLSKGTILINKQLQKVVGQKEYHLVSTKNSKSCCITPPQFVLTTLKKVKRQQLENRMCCGECYTETNIVFTNE